MNMRDIALKKKGFISFMSVRKTVKFLGHRSKFELVDGAFGP